MIACLKEECILQLTDNYNKIISFQKQSSFPFHNGTNHSTTGI